MNPIAKSVDDTLDSIARASGESPTAFSVRQLARHAILDYRQRQSPILTQERIDNGGDKEGRRQRFVSSSLKFRRRGLFARLFR